MLPCINGCLFTIQLVIHESLISMSHIHTLDMHSFLTKHAISMCIRQSLVECSCSQSYVSTDDDFQSTRPLNFQQNYRRVTIMTSRPAEQNLPSASDKQSV